MSRDRIDVAVIGGGPAGARCAALLAHAGARVALVDRVQRRPASVELLSGRARWLVRDLELGGIVVDETHSCWDGGEPLVRSSFWDPYGPALAVDRGELDAVLRDQATRAGAMWLEQRVTEIPRVHGLWCLADGVTADWVVVATGSGVPALGRRGHTLLRQRAVLARYRQRRAPRLCIEKLARGWLYSVPDPRGGTFVGLCHDGDASLGRGLASSRLLADLDRTSLHERWSCAASVRSYDRVAGPGWIAVGNAAFTPDPLSGGGLWFGLHTAAGAMEVVLGRSSTAAYQAEIEAQVHDHLESRRALSVGDRVTVPIQP